MNVEAFINNFPKGFIESVDKDYDALKARIIFTPEINNKYGGHIFQVIFLLNNDLEIKGLGFMGGNLEPLQRHIQMFNEFENQYCIHSVIDNLSFPHRLTVVCSF